MTWQEFATLRGVDLYMAENDAIIKCHCPWWLTSLMTDNLACQDAANVVENHRIWRYRTGKRA